MKWLNKPEVAAFLRTNGVTSPNKVAEIISGFDFDKPIYEQTFEGGSELYQFIRNASAGDSGARVGNWFAIVGGTTKGVAIIDGGAGRRLHRFRVVRPFSAIEGTATAQEVNWAWAGGGPGGATQIYIPPRFIGHLVAVSPAERW